MATSTFETLPIFQCALLGGRLKQVQDAGVERRAHALEAVLKTVARIGRARRTRVVGFRIPPSFITQSLDGIEPSCLTRRVKSKKNPYRSRKNDG